MCVVSNTSDLIAGKEKIEKRIADIEKYHPKIHAALEPLLDDLKEWLGDARNHIERLYSGLENERVRQKPQRMVISLVPEE